MENIKKIELPIGQIDLAFERLFKNFKKEVERDGIMDELKRRRYYIKPSMEKRLRKLSKGKNGGR